MTLKTDHNLFNTLLYTGLALTAFAGNSVLCRLALSYGAIDPVGFTVIRVLSGAVMFAFLFGCVIKTAKPVINHKKSALNGAFLFIYAMAFSYAYLTLDTGSGALVLFGAVQLSMVFYSAFIGERFRLIEIIGIGIAFLGLCYLLFPMLGSPSITGFALMALAGIAWAGYTLMGKHSVTPLFDNAVSFYYGAIFAVLFASVTFQSMQLSAFGVLLAVLSGVFASALGYSVWYLALGRITTSVAAVSQLSVPIIAALFGILLVGDLISTRLAFASVLVLGGMLMVILTKQTPRK